uniref:Uncharacterized protein n=1 Tax=Anguilla anguilla TaxID=7936 RepID=A0A0E9RTL0_ANGAN
MNTIKRECALLHAILKLSHWQSIKKMLKQVL